MSRAYLSEPRSPLEVTFAVWKALFLREAVSRLSARRGAWAWMLVDPVFHISYITAYHSIIRERTIGGINATIWVMIGVLSFNLFIRTVLQGSNAVAANQALFVYRQIKPIDTVLTRAVLEGVLMIVVAVVLLSIAAMFGLDALPDDPLTVMGAVLGIWLIAVGYGLTTCVIKELAPEIGKILTLAMLPLSVVSGTIFPVYSVPEPYRGWLMLNPLAHGLEALRGGFSSYYHVMSETNIVYFYVWTLVFLFIGLLMQIRFADKLVAK